MIVAFSGGKDSTALALRLTELGESFSLLHTATGNELPGVRDHALRVAEHCGAEFVDLEAPTLATLIEEQNCLPNWRMRWCTRMIKIEPALEFYEKNPGQVICVGLRADEEGRIGIEADPLTYDVEIRYPLREWGWVEKDVIDYCAKQGFSPPPRTDCAVCFYQTLYEWWALWKNHPGEYEQGIQWELQTGHTFRSPQRDSRPASLADLRVDFDLGYKPKPRRRKGMCRVCSS